MKTTDNGIQYWFPIAHPIIEMQYVSIANPNMLSYYCLSNHAGMLLFQLSPAFLDLPILLLSVLGERTSSVRQRSLLESPSFQGRKFESSKLCRQRQADKQRGGERESVADEGPGLQGGDAEILSGAQHNVVEGGALVTAAVIQVAV